MPGETPWHSGSRRVWRIRTRRFDAIAFEALSHFMRERQLNESTMTTLEQDLVRKLGVQDRGGFQQPFAALALSEIARADLVDSTPAG